ncbi:ParA family protein [Halorientalis marina]|uniref:ParA family protein n=1 Tax=Halorientalis marina TaxID=2931976 RepID=UPI001FF533E6|nr:ParA family protein [Halorientalis marina]
MTGAEGRPAAICVTNAKGGTGKTTVAINVAGALNERGRDVLFVDLDPQGNATEGLGLVEAYDAAPPTLFDVLTDPEQRDALSDIVVSHPEMDVVPSNIDMLQAEHELTLANVMAKLAADPTLDGDPAGLAPLTINAGPSTVEGDHALDALHLALAELETDYDYVVVDSPPFYGQLTDTAIYAARNVLIPALTEATSERAIELLFDQIAALEDRTGISITELGVVANRVESTNEDEEMLQWLETVFSDVPVWAVRKRVALQRSFSQGESLFRYDPTVDMADVFTDIATTLDERFGYVEEVTA